MEKDVNCNVCGGTDFFIEAGHYYCGECQTQSQDIREHVFAFPDPAATGRNVSFKRVRTEKKSIDQLTSWECYNYIILGLVNELIELGAGAKLKQNVHYIWFKYLQTLEVISDKSDVPPRLSAVNSQKDAQIIYGRKRHKRGRTSRTPSPSGSSEISSVDTTSRREKAKQKRSMILSQYDEISTQQSEEATSVHNQSLISLRSGSDSSKDRDKFLHYNKTAKKELLKIMTKNHLKTHCRDVTSVLDCHKVSYRALSSKYVHSANVISRNKIYALIYLGLMINKDKIQLGDMLRFIREGKLSFHEIKHFFPEEYEEKNLNIKNWDCGHITLTHYGIRKVAAEIAKQIGIVKFICRQDLAALCQRYCCELNLPDQVWGYSLNLMSRAVPQMHFTNKSKSIPNYEGRVMSIIMFVLKLFFGLDEVTEDKFTAYAETINNLKKSEQKMFIWKNWTYYIKYRKLVLTQHHFPTQNLFGEDTAQNPELFINFSTEQNLKYERNDPSTREVEVLQHLLEKLRDRQETPKLGVDFKSSLTPFRDYVSTLLDSPIPVENNYLIDVLDSSFKNHSFNFLINPLGYLQELNKDAKVGIKNRGANNNLKMIKVPNFKVKRECWRNAAKHEVLVKLTDQRIPTSSETSTKHLRKIKTPEELNSKEIISNFMQAQMRTYKKNLRKSMKIQERRQGSQVTQLGLDETLNLQQSSDRRNYIHYNPYDRYWLKNIDVENISKEEFLEFIQTFPESFQLVLNECARITEQSAKSLFEEFLNVEVFLCYVAEFTRKDKLRDRIVNKDLVRFINRAKKNW